MISADVSLRKKAVPREDGLGLCFIVASTQTTNETLLLGFPAPESSSQRRDA